MANYQIPVSPPRLPALPPRRNISKPVWPINVALLVIAGFIAGGIIALTEFDDRRLLHNAWFLLITLALTVGFVIWGTTMSTAKGVRRTQLAAVISLLIHFGMMVVIYNQQVPIHQRRTLADTKTLRVTVRYAEPDKDAIDEPLELEEPTPTEVETPEIEITEPKIATQPIELIPKVAQEDPAVPSPAEEPAKNEPAPLPEAKSQIETSRPKVAEHPQSAPRRADEPSRISKQRLKTESRSNVAATPAEPKEPVAKEIAVDAKNLKPTKREQETKPDTRMASEQPAAVPATQQQATKLAKRDAPETPNKTSSVPTLNRSLNKPVATPKVAADTPQPVATAPNVTPNELKPNAATVDRQTSPPPIAKQVAAEPTPGKTPKPSRIDAALQRPNEAPRLASSPPTKQTKATAALQVSVGTAADGPQATINSGPIGTALTPRVAQVGRGEAQAPGNSQTKAIGDAPDAPPATLGGPKIARSQPADAPSVRPQAPVTANRARALRTADTAASPVNIESPGISLAAGSQLEAAPSKSAISKGAGGTTGVGRDVNFQRAGETARGADGTAAGEGAGSLGAGSLASGAPRRAARGDGGGPGTNANTAGARSKLVANAKIPHGNVAAADVPTGVGTGGGNGGGSGGTGGAGGGPGGAGAPGSIDASATAGVRHGNSSAPRGALGSSTGSANIGGGSAQIVANATPGKGRGDLGEGPTVRLDAVRSGPSRRGSGGGALPAISAPTYADTPQAPAGDGGGAPLPAVESSVAGATRSSAGGGATPVPGIIGAGDEAGLGGVASTGVNAGDGIGSKPSRASGIQDALPGPPVIGGTTKPGRGTGRVPIGAVVGDVVEPPTGPTTGETPSLGGGVPAPGDVVVNSSSGIPGRAVEGPVGATAGDVAIDSTVVGSPGNGPAIRRDPQANPAAPEIAPTATVGAIGKTNVAGVSKGAQADAIPLPEIAGSPGDGGAGGDAENGNSSELAQPGAITDLPRSSGAIPVQLAALEGPGGLGTEVSVSVGTTSRFARRESEIVHTGTDRFLNRAAGGPILIDGRAREPAPAFKRRRGRELDPVGEYGQPLERTEEAVELGLQFLARHQSPDGNWSLDNYGGGRPGYERETSELHSDTAATGLALLAFLGAGYDHYDDNYAGQIRQGLEFLLRNQKTNGDLFIPMDDKSNQSVWFYSHGIATLALCEAFGMTGDPDLREPAQKAIDFIVKAQDKKFGGWRYGPGTGSDTSVSGWQLMALKSGELAGLKVPKETYENVQKWLDSAEKSADGKTRYVYNPFAPTTIKYGREPTAPTTSMGLLMRLYTGWNRQDPRMKAGCDFLLQHPPQIGTTQQPLRDSYYWYYATQLMFHMKGDYWKQWNARLHPMLVNYQVQTGPLAGSWDPRTPVKDQWGPHGGRIYVTTLNLLSLEVYYRHLPLYEETAK